MDILCGVWVFLSLSLLFMVHGYIMWCMGIFVFIIIVLWFMDILCGVWVFLSSSLLFYGLMDILLGFAVSHSLGGT